MPPGVFQSHHSNGPKPHRIYELLLPATLAYPPAGRRPLLPFFSCQPISHIFLQACCFTLDLGTARCMTPVNKRSSSKVNMIWIHGSSLGHACPIVLTAPSAPLALYAKLSLSSISNAQKSHQGRVTTPWLFYHVSLVFPTDRWSGFFGTQAVSLPREPLIPMKTTRRCPSPAPRSEYQSSRNPVSPCEAVVT